MGFTTLLRWILLAGTALAAIQSATAAVPDEPFKPGFVPMNQQGLGKVIRSMSSEVSGSGSQILFVYGGVKMACISDARHNRMRIIAPVTEIKNISAEQRDIMLEANFHLTLDARYAFSDGVLYAAFIHPLSSLHEQELSDAIKQVSQLVQNFGSSYSSGKLSYGGTSRR